MYYQKVTNIKPVQFKYVSPFMAASTKRFIYNLKTVELQILENHDIPKMGGGENKTTITVIH